MHSLHSPHSPPNPNRSTTPNSHLTVAPLSRSPSASSSVSLIDAHSNTHVASASTEGLIAPPQKDTSVSNLARRIHGWSWQSYPIGMGTGAVYVTLSSVSPHPPWLTYVETGFWALNMFLFVVNTVMLAIQAFCAYSLFIYSRENSG
jgi:hypothetical protein